MSLFAQISAESESLQVAREHVHRSGVSQAKPTGSASPGRVRVRVRVRLLVRSPHFVVLFFTYWCDVGVRLAPCTFVLTRP